MPIVSIDNENDEQNSADKPYNASDMRRVPVAAGAAAPPPGEPCRAALQRAGRAFSGFLQSPAEWPRRR